MNYYLVLMKDGVIDRQLLFTSAFTFEEAKHDLLKEYAEDDGRDIAEAKKLIVDNEEYYELKILEEKKTVLET